MIRKTRTAVGMTQEKLSEDICAQETLARVENGRQTPQSRKLQQMMEKMGRGCGRVNMAMVTEQYETIELEEFIKASIRIGAENMKIGLADEFGREQNKEKRV